MTPARTHTLKRRKMRHPYKYELHNITAKFGEYYHIYQVLKSDIIHEVVKLLFISLSLVENNRATRRQKSNSAIA